MKKKNGISLAIPLRDMHGLAQDGRSFLAKLSLTNFDFDVRDISADFYFCDENINKITTNKSCFKKRLLFNTCEGNLPKDYYNMKVIFWEFESGMLQVRPKIFDGVNEVVTFSDFVFDYVKKIAPENTKVTKIKYPFIKNWNIIDKSVMRERFGIKPNDFVGFFNFDYKSSYRRKNPEAIIKAFAQGVGQKEDAVLVLKTINDNIFPDLKNSLTELAKELNVYSKIIFIDECLSRDEMVSLINASDYYISLHRGEGLGLGMLEAMALGKPVVATNYSGNTEFMNSQNSLLVDYTLVDAQDDFEAYRFVEKWAEPNVETAKNYLLELYSNPDYAKMIGENAKKFVEDYYSIEEFKKQITEKFGISERNHKASCLSQKHKKIYFLQGIQNKIEAIKKRMCLR